MAEKTPITLQEVLENSQLPAPGTPLQDGFYFLSIREGVINKIPYAALTLSPAERAARGERVWVRGYANSAGDLPDQATQDVIDVLLGEGWPDWAIIWECLGADLGTLIGSLAIPAISIRPTINVLGLSGIQLGGFSAQTVSAQPVVVAVPLVGIPLGSLLTPAVNVQPVVVSATLVGVREGIFSAQTVSITPQVATFGMSVQAPGEGLFSSLTTSILTLVVTNTLVGVQTGQFLPVAGTVQPVVSPTTLLGIQAGQFNAVSASTRPTVSPSTLVGIRVGQFLPAVVTVQPVVSLTPLLVTQVAAFIGIPTSIWPIVAAPTLTVGVAGPVTVDFETATSLAGPYPSGITVDQTTIFTLTSMTINSVSRKVITESRTEEAPDLIDSVTLTFPVHGLPQTGNITIDVWAVYPNVGTLSIEFVAGVNHETKDLTPSGSPVGELMKYSATFSYTTWPISACLRVATDMDGNSQQSIDSIVFTPGW